MAAMQIKRDEFQTLYTQAYEQYLTTEAGRAHLAFYASQRAEARGNLEEIRAMRARGEDITDAVLLKLLPYADTTPNRAAGAWACITPAITGNVRHWFERAKWTQRSDWPAIAQALLELVERCTQDPTALAEACDAFVALPYSKGFQSGMVSPILNALSPDAFRIMNNKSRVTYNYLAGTNHGHALIEYAQANATAIQLREELRDVISSHALPTDTRPDDALDAFGHWLVAIRKLDFTPLKVLAQEQVDLLLGHVRRAFPDWTGFTDPRFIWHELQYKRNGAEKAAELLSEKELKRLLKAGDYDEIVARLDTVGKASNLLYRSVPKSGDLGILHQEKLDRPSFCRIVMDLLYGPGPSEERLDRYLQYVAAADLPNKWTFPTYFLFLCHPESEMFVKPNTTRWLFETLDRASDWESKPSPAAYARLKAISQDVLAALAPYGATDMIDVQSVMYTGFGYKEGEVVDGWEGFRTVNEKQGDETHETGNETEGQDPVRYWKIAPGEGASIWDECRQNGYIALGWHEVQDISGMDRTAFDAHISALAQQGEGLTVQGMRQVWQFAHDVQIGDRIIANHGTKQIVGIGTVTGEYYHVPGERYSQRRSVRWDIEQPIDVDEPGWIKTLIELDEAKFNTLVAGERPAESGLAEPFSRIFADRDEARWAFALMRESLEHLGVTGPDDQRFRVSLRSSTQGGVRLRLVFANVLAVGFRGPASSPRHVEFSLVRDRAASHGWPPTFDYRMPGGAAEISVYALPREQGIRVLSDLKPDYLATLDVFRETHGHWERASRLAAPQPEIQRALFDSALLERLLTEGLQTPPAVATETVAGYFDEETFALLEGLQETPTRAFYLNHKDGFVEHVEEPLQALFSSVVALLPEPVREFMETEKNVFSRILKNDFGRGGAWTWYWGAMYKKGGRRIENGQLYISIQSNGITFGANMGQYSREARQRYERNTRENAALLLQALVSRLPDAIGTVAFGPEDGSCGSLEEWSHDAGHYPRIEQYLDADLVLSSARGDLADEISAFLTALFPLILFIELDDPLPAAHRFLGDDVIDLEVQPEHRLEQIAQATSLPLVDLDAWVRAIERKGQAVLYGPPGTGKTFVARHLAQHLVGGTDGFWDLVQFHPSYAYEDFVQGIRPQQADGGGLDYPVLAGRFVRFCREAALRTGPCVLIIDEINRANLARVFGELMYLLEYRGDEVSLAVDGRQFGIPPNVRIIGTMNTADRSIALVDHALRRRFAFIRLDPEYDVLTSFHRQHNPGFSTAGLIALLQRLNNRIADPHYAVGISFFLVDDVIQHVESIWRMEIEPYLEEYFFDNRNTASAFSWANVRNEVLGA